MLAIADKESQTSGESAMDFYEVVGQVLELLQRQGRVSYRALKRQYGLDDDYIEDLKIEIIRAQKLAIDEDGEILVWTGESGETPELTSTSAPVSEPEFPRLRQ